VPLVEDDRYNRALVEEWVADGNSDEVDARCCDEARVFVSSKLGIGRREGTPVRARGSGLSGSGIEASGIISGVGGMTRPIVNEV